MADAPEVPAECPVCGEQGTLVRRNCKIVCTHCRQIINACSDIE